MGKISNFLVGSLLAQSLVNIFGYVTLYMGGGGGGGVLKTTVIPTAVFI